MMMPKILLMVPKASPEGRDCFFSYYHKLTRKKKDYQKRRPKGAIFFFHTTKNGQRNNWKKKDYQKWPPARGLFFSFCFFFPGFRKSGKSGPIYRFRIFMSTWLIYSGTWKVTSPRLRRGETRNCNFLIIAARVDATRWVRFGRKYCPGWK